MTEFNLKNKVAVITGGARGIGFAIAENFLKNGAKTIILLDILDIGVDAASKLNSKYGSGKTIFIKCDITNDVDTVTQNIFENYDHIDILVNCAGIGGQSVRKTMEVNAIALMELSTKFYEHMSGNNGDTIINISSGYGFYIDSRGPIYKASKFAVMGFSRSLGHEDNYKKSGVRVVVLCPAVTRTDMIQNGIWDENDIQEPDDVGRAAVEVYERAKSGSAWLVKGGQCTELLFHFTSVTE